MTVDELIEAIKESYDERLRNSKYSGSASLRVIETIAAKTGLTMSMVLLKHLDKQYPDGEIPEADLRRIVADSLEHNYSYIAEETRRAQEKILEEAEVGIKPIVPEFNRGRAEGIAKNYSETGNREEFKKNIQNHSQNIVDESIKQNARVHQSLGLEPRVTRIYDGIGVHKRKDPCEWCKARAGVDMPYSEAYEKGVFQRHPGCGCELIYKVGKRTQRQSDWRFNEWEDIDGNKGSFAYTYYNSNRKNGIINIEIDGLVPCLKDVKTGEYVDTEVSRITNRKELKGYNKKTGWYTNWANAPKDVEIYKLCVKGDDTIQGLIGLIPDDSHQAVHLYWGVAAPHNNAFLLKGRQKKYEGVGGHLFAIAAEKSLDYGYGGAMYGYAANVDLLKLYTEKYGARHLPVEHQYEVFFDEAAAINILKEYSYEWKE